MPPEIVDREDFEPLPRARRRRFRIGRFILPLIVLVLIGAQTLARWWIDYQWWGEIGQLDTWFTTLIYGILPLAGASLLAFAVLWVAHARAVKAGGGRLATHRGYLWISTAAALFLGFLISAVTIDTWTVVRYAGGQSVARGGWHDPVFNKPLAFYFFDLPFYNVLLAWLLGVAILAALVFWVTARAWGLRISVGEWRKAQHLEFTDLVGSVDSSFLRVLGAIALLALAARILLGRYELLFSEHGALTGIDWVDERIALPLRWITMGVCLLAAGLVVGRRARLALPLLLIFPIQMFVPRIVHAVYVRPNEISIQRPYIERHIAATRAAYGLDRRSREIEFPARMEARIDAVKHKPLLDNVRLWDWRAFHDTVSQIQALRPYYVFQDSDVDRYTIDGSIQQVLLTPRELDIRQLAEARTRWVNPHFIYTHGYGLVMAEANRITAEGLPVLLIQDAPPIVNSKDLKLTRPEIYYGEVVHEPVFTRTAQPEFNYPQGAGKVDTRYEGQGGFLIKKPLTRLAAAVAYSDYNILLTDILQDDSRMMIRREIKDRLREVAGFLRWDTDPYLVLTDAGRLVWMADGFTASGRHPYSRTLGTDNIGSMNYIRNSVKATVDAYDGSVHLYVFDPEDPLIQAWQGIYDKLFQPASAMPADLRRHARYPETMFRIQAEIYRTFHMTDPEAFYNKEDLWDLARNLNTEANPSVGITPTYVVAALPGEQQAEFLLMIPFTPRNKDNMIGLMVARCDGDRLGELYFLQLSKQALIFGPMQIEARINQDQVISKDLNLWNQQGSKVLRGQMLVLPVENTFLYIEPIYIQAEQARMPQLKKVVIAMGNHLIYEDTYEQALAKLLGTRMPAGEAPKPPAAETPATTTTTAAPAPPGQERAIETVRNHLRRYRELSAQGRWAEAGKELEALEAAVNGARRQ